MKRVVDFSAAVAGGVVLAPLLIVVAFLVWLQDRKSPFYIAPHMAHGGRHVQHGQVPLDGEERRPRRCRFDECERSADHRDRSLHPSLQDRRAPTALERRQGRHEPRRSETQRRSRGRSLHRRGATPPRRPAGHHRSRASIVFADEGDILADEADPDIAYNQLIRPGKSRLGLFYVDHRTTLMDLRILRLTVVNSLSRERALNAVFELLGRAGAPDDLVRLATREDELVAAPPPGADAIVTTRDR